ncbi:MAG: hypothetical protein WC710_15285 [Gallionella sp.]|jgi:L-aminopeptidase/D-esterase-like protein
MDRKRLARGAVGTGTGTLAYTVPSGYRAKVTDIDIANTTAADLTVILCLVPAGDSVAAANRLMPTMRVPANKLIQWTGAQELSTGDFIQVIGSGAGLTMHISGEEGRQ